MSAPKPMLCKDAPGKPPRLPEGEGWIIEPKLDGWRFLFEVTESGVRSWAGRNSSDRTGEAPGVEAALAFLPVGTIVDCELIAPGESSGAVQTRLSRGGELVAVAFDLLQVAGHDVRGLPWSERRKLLEKAAEGFDGENVRISPVHEPSEEQHQAWLDAGFEGSVAKRTSGIYRSGARSADTLKVKPQTSDEAEVIGFLEGKNGHAGKVGALKIRMLRTGAETSVKPTNDAQQDEVTADPDSWLGRIVEIRHHGLDPDSGKPRHPTNPKPRPDRDPVAS